MRKKVEKHLYRNDMQDRVIPGNALSKEILEEAFPDCDEYDGVSFIYRSGMGRKTVFVPGLTEYLGAHPRE